MKKLEAAGNYVLVQPDAVQEKTTSGLIYVPEMAQEAAKRNIYKGKIISIGPVAFKDFACSWGAKEGDRIVFAKSGSLQIEKDTDEIRDPNNDLIFAINDEDVIAVYRATTEEATQLN